MAKLSRAKRKIAPLRISLKVIEEEFGMSGRNSIMSDKLKMEIAKELGVYDTVQSKGWGDVSSKDCGNIVRKAIEMAERNSGSG
jgi:small acid-soluble spore protein F (minor alpha/beta-type SASP)